MDEHLRPARLEIDLSGRQNRKRRITRRDLYGVAAVCTVMFVLLPHAARAWVVAGAYWVFALATFAVAIMIPWGELRLWKMPARWTLSALATAWLVLAVLVTREAIG